MVSAPFFAPRIYRRAKQIETRAKASLLQLADLISEGEDGLSDVIRSRELVKIVEREQETDPGDDDA